MSEKDYFNYEQLIDNYYNETEIIREVMKVYIKTVNQELDDLKSLVFSKNIEYEKIRFICHSIKGSSYNMTCKKIGDIAFEIQKMCDANEIKDLSNKFSDLIKISEITFNIMKKSI